MHHAPDTAHRILNRSEAWVCCVGVLVAAPHRLTEPPRRAARTRGSATARDSASLPLRPTLVGPDCVC